MAVITLGAIGVAGGIFSGILGAQQEKANAAAQIAQIRYQNAIRGMETDLANIQALEKWGAQFKQAKLQAVAAGARAGQKKFYLRETLSNQFKEVGNQTSSINASLISKASGKGLSTSSGTVKAIMRQNIKKSSESNAAIISNFKKQMKNVDSELAGSISSAQFLQPALRTFYATPETVPDNSGSILAASIVNGTVGGLSAGASSEMDIQGQGLFKL
jgi:hypothetical protein